MSRIVSVLLAILFATFANAGLLWVESQGKICPPDEQTKAEKRMEDPLFGRQFNPAARERNIKEFGFDPTEVKAILKQISALEQRYGTTDPNVDRVTTLLEGSDDDNLESAFCMSDTNIPVRYGAMNYLVKERDGVLTPLDLDVVSSFERQEWAAAARIQASFNEAELTNERKDDAPRMVMAAILSHDETSLLEHKSPWGRAVLVGGWSWAGVEKKHPGVQQRVKDYVALMHLVLEVASREGGLCAT